LDIREDNEPQNEVVPPDGSMATPPNLQWKSNLFHATGRCGSFLSRR
jgi:hypothetical protein